MSQADQAFARLRDGLEWLASGSHLTARPPSMREAHAHVHEVASRYEALALKVPRVVWGYGHLTLKAVLHLIEWVTRSPVTFICAAVLVTLAVFFI